MAAPQKPPLSLRAPESSDNASAQINIFVYCTMDTAMDGKRILPEIAGD